MRARAHICVRARVSSRVCVYALCVANPNPNLVSSSEVAITLSAVTLRSGSATGGAELLRSFEACVSFETLGFPSRLVAFPFVFETLSFFFGDFLPAGGSSRLVPGWLNSSPPSVDIWPSVRVTKM